MPTTPLFNNLCHRWFPQVNIFKSGSQDPKTLRYERCSTWIYITMVIAILGAFSVHTGSRRQTTSVTVKNPSYSTFESLHRKYPNTLQCPCLNTAVQYSTYSHIRGTLHQVCALIRLLTILSEYINDCLKV
jgi:hypothetical protein